ncbi:MAG TPA: hypothetical protein VEY67_10870 [Candidatus Dormibacteraeota bacterium]|nr:hypothetical protein [Candidatus Dormibacteraeota bacterium]
MPFGLFRRKQDEASGSTATGPPAGQRTGRPIAFEALTDEWRLRGSMQVDGRLSDALNRREPIRITDVLWAPADGSAELQPAGFEVVDPYDLVLVITGPSSLPVLTDSERVAFKVHKVAYDVALEAPPYRVIGTVYLYPGSEPDRLLDRSSEMFVPVADATAYLGDRKVSGDEADAVLLNRFYLRGVEQVDKRTGERHPTLPGQPLGGTSWMDRSR